MKHRDGYFEASGLNLYYQMWLPESDIRAVLILIHGGGDHSGRFGNVAAFLVPNGYGMCMFDLRGHGKSPGKRGHIDSWNDYRHDVAAFHRMVRKTFPDHPLFLFGHSMGGAIVLDYCIRENPSLEGVIVTSPAIGALGISPLLFQAAKILNRLAPSWVLPTGLVVPHLSRDTAFVSETRSDPLYHSRATPRFGMEFAKTVQFIREQAGTFQLPLYIIHGTDDRIASIEGSRDFVSKLDPAKVEYQEYPGGYHELFNDLDKEQVLTHITNWLDKKTGESPSGS